MFQTRTSLLMVALASLMLLGRASGTPVQCSPGSTLTSSGVCVSVRYIEGCFQYESFERCASCEFNYDLKDGICDYSPKDASRCCLQFDSNGECKQCQTGLFLREGACNQATLVGCLEKAQGKCTNCATGFYLGEGACRKGHRGCATYNGDGLCTACTDGFIFQEGRCIKRTRLGCAEQNNSACTKCYDPFTLVNGGCEIANCSNSNEFGCLECQDGFFLREGACKEHIKGCHYYQKGRCASCQANYAESNDGCVSQGCVRMGDNYECLECAKPFELKNRKCEVSNCLSHADGKCVGCQPNYHLSKGQCYAAANCTNYVSDACRVCAPSFYISKSLKCAPFDVGCTAYQEGVCTSCSSPFEISSDGTCTIDGCAATDNTGCLKCQPAYEQKGRVCKLPNCEVARRGVCQRCSAGYIAKSGLCSKMDPNCAQYTSDGTCGSCIGGYHLDAQAKCKLNLAGCLYTGGDCSSCISPFKYADGACAIVGCEEYASDGCRRCGDTLYLSGGICKLKQPGCQYDSAGNCRSCLDAFSFKDGQCSIEGCSTYTLTACTACDAPYRLAKGQCFIPNCAQTAGGKCSRCNQGYQAIASGACQRFILNCNDYDGDSCQTCKGGFYLAAGKDRCLPAEPGCIYGNGFCVSCLDGYLFDGGVCIKQDPNCLAQGRDRKCTKCKDTFYIDTTGTCQQGDLQCDEFATSGDGKCKSCKTNYYVNELSGCSQMQPGCEYRNGKWASCVAPFVAKDSTCQITGCLSYSSQGCLSCSPTYSLLNFSCRAKDDGSCLDFDTNGLCTRCERGYTLMEGHCEVTDSKCVRKSEGGKCLQCNAGYFLTDQGTCENVAKGCKSYKNGQCVECISQYFLWQEICFPYVTGCVRYSGKSCIECSTDYKVSQGICVKKMKDWSFGDVFSKKVETFQNTSGTVPTAIQSKQYAAGSLIGKLTYSSLYNFSYLNYQVTDKVSAQGGWRAKSSNVGEWVGLSLRTPQTFYQVQIQKADDDSYVSEFTVEFRLNNEAWKEIPQVFVATDCSSGQISSIDFVTAVVATEIRIVVKKFVKWPACRFDFIYNNFDERNEWQGIRNIAEIDKKIAGTMGARLDNQLDINIRNFFVPTRDCKNKEQCWSGAEFCEPKQVTGFSFDQSDPTKGSITEAFVDYSLDGLLFVCYKDCAPVSLSGLKSIVFDKPLKAKKIRVHPTKWSANPEVRFSFDYS